jgi:hypothetical protein
VRGQLPLLLPSGEPWSEDAYTRWLRVRVLESLAEQFGEVRTGVECPDCRGELVVLPMVRRPVAWCRCGFVFDLGAEPCVMSGFGSVAARG